MPAATEGVRGTVLNGSMSVFSGRREAIGLAPSLIEEVSCAVWGLGWGILSNTTCSKGAILWRPSTTKKRRNQFQVQILNLQLGLHLSSIRHPF